MGESVHRQQLSNFAQQQFDMLTGRAGDQTTNPEISGQPALPPDPLPYYYFSQNI